MIKNILLKYFCPFAFLFLFVNYVAYTQETYYWYFDKKVPVNYNYSTWVIKAQKNRAPIPETLGLEKSEIESISAINSEFYQVNLNTATNILKNTNNSIIPSVTIGNGKEPVLMNGNIILMPQEETNIENILKKYNLTLIEKLNYGAFLLKVKSVSEILETANIIHENELAKWCSPEFFVPIQVNSTDPLYTQQYYLNQNNNIDINAPEAWSITKGCSDIRVAVLDQGVENHEDLSGRVLSGFTPGSNNTYGQPINSGEAHGIACAGIIAATHENDIGIKGIAPSAKIIPIKILGDGYGYTSSEIATAITWSYLPSGGNSDILSNSWGSCIQGYYDASIAQSISDARTFGRGGKGSVVVFASGNSNQSWSGVCFPANLPGVIAVGAIKADGSIWDYSSRGGEMDLVAPSGNTNLLGDVVTTDRMNSLGY